MKYLWSAERETDAMTMSSTIGAAAAAVFTLILALSVAALADRLIWLHTGHRVLGSINLDHFPALRGLCPPASAWAEVKESRTARLFAYRCEDASWSWPFPIYGQSPELEQLWRERTGVPPGA